MYTIKINCIPRPLKMFITSKKRFSSHSAKKCANNEMKNIPKQQQQKGFQDKKEEVGEKQFYSKTSFGRNKMFSI